MRRLSCTPIDIIRNMSPSRILGEEMKKLKDLADKSLVVQILDNEAYGTKVQQIFQRVEGATKSFFVRTIIIIRPCIFIFVVPSSKWRSAFSKPPVRYTTISR